MTKYEEVVSELRKAHAELLQHEKEGRLSDARNNPGLIGDYQLKLTLHSTLLRGYENNLLDLLNDQLVDYAAKREKTFKDTLMQPKVSNSAAESFARETTRTMEADIKVTENNLKKVRNEIDRYEKIVMGLMSVQKSHNLERMGN